MRKAVPILLGAETALLGLLYLYLCRRCGPFGFPLDDSWIHATFARNIAEGKGIVYNVGQPMTSTAMLYSLILAGLYAVTKAPVANAIALGLLLHFGSGMLVYLIGRRLSLNPVLSFSAAALMIAIPRLVWGAVSGMEVPLYVFLVCLGIYWHTRYSWTDGAKAHLAALAFAVAALARPECGFFAACSVVDRLFRRLRSGPRIGRWQAMVKYVLIDAAILCAIVAPLALYNIHSYGKPLPPAFYAKVSGASSAIDGYVVSDLLQQASFVWAAVYAAAHLNPVLGLLMAPGVFFFLRAAGKGKEAVSLLLPLAFLCVPLATGIAARIARDPVAQFGFQHGRYSAYLGPLLALIGIAGLAQLLELLRNQASRRVVAAGFLSAAVAFVLLANWSCAKTYGLEVQNINDMQVAFGRWAAQLPRDTVLAVNDAGAIPYFSRLRILDTVGVVNPEVVPFARGSQGAEPGLLEYLRKHKPEYVIIFPSWYPALASLDGALHPVKAIRLEHNVICGASEMVAYRTTWY